MDQVLDPPFTQLGLLNEPGAILVRPDSTIAVVLNTLSWHNETITNVIEWHDEKAVIDAIAAGNIEEAKRIVFLRTSTEPPVSDDPKKKKPKAIEPSLTHLRARARVYLALKDYDKALADIEEVISKQLGTDGGMSLRTKDLEEAEQFRDQLQTLRDPKKEKN